MITPSAIETEPETQTDDEPASALVTAPQLERIAAATETRGLCP